MKKKILKGTITREDAQGVARLILGLDATANNEVIDQHLCDNFNTDIEVFEDIINRLLPLIDVGKSPLTGEVYKGFSNIENKEWLARIKA